MQHYLVTGVIYVDGAISETVVHVREKAADKTEAALAVERRLAGPKTMEWREGPAVVSLPPDMQMRYVAQAATLPGLEEE